MVSTFPRLVVVDILLDIGGGAVPNSTQHSLADITLRWMVRQVVDSTCGVLFVKDALDQLDIPLDKSPDLPEPSSDPERSANADKLDAIQPLDDELKRQPLWWILEVLPLQYRYQDVQGEWKTTYK